MEGKESAPAALAFTGSKPTNHARKVARISRSSCLRRLPVLFDLVVERAEDVGDGALFSREAGGEFQLSGGKSRAARWMERLPQTCWPRAGAYPQAT